jgi:hypothetical protein
VSAPERKRGGPAKRTSSTDNSSQVDQTTASSPRPAPNAEPVSGRSDDHRRSSSPADSPVFPAPNASKRRTRSSTGDLPVPAASPKTVSTASLTAHEKKTDCCLGCRRCEAWPRPTQGLRQDCDTRPCPQRPCGEEAGGP